MDTKYYMNDEEPTAFIYDIYKGDFTEIINFVSLSV